MKDPVDEQIGPDETEENRKEEEGSEAKGEEATAVDIGSLDTYTTLKLFLSVLAGQAWRRMGLVADPRTNKVEKDIEQARTAIDCFELIFKRIENRLSEDEKRRMNSLLSDLQLNFVTHQ